GEAQRAAKKFFELLSERQRDQYMMNPRYGRSAARKDHRNGYYLRDFVTRFGTLRLRIARSRKRGFLPQVMAKFQRRAEEVCLLIREAFFARDLDAPGRTSGGPADGGSGKRANRVAANARSGRSRAPVPSGAAGRRVGVLISRRSEFAGASPEWPATGADA